MADCYAPVLINAIILYLSIFTEINGIPGYDLGSILFIPTFGISGSLS